MKVVFLLVPHLEQMMKNICNHDQQLNLCLVCVHFVITTHLNKITSILQFSLYTMMVFDEWYNGVPMVYIITSSYKQHDLALWMDALNKSLVMLKNNWHPNAFIVNDVKVEINNIR